MTVYVDDARIRATVAGVRGRWSHLSADSREELHAFAARLGLKREWFQDPCALGRKPWPAKPGSPAAEMWHYDVTDSMRSEAIRLGAKAVTGREAIDVVRERCARLYGTVSPRRGEEVPS